MTIVTLQNREIDFDAAVNLMDDEIRESLHMQLAPCSDQEFIDQYVIEHQKKYGEDFAIN